MKLLILIFLKQGYDLEYEETGRELSTVNTINQMMY